MSKRRYSQGAGVVSRPPAMFAITGSRLPTDLCILDWHASAWVDACQFIEYVSIILHPRLNLWRVSKPGGARLGEDAEQHGACRWGYGIIAPKASHECRRGLSRALWVELSAVSSKPLSGVALLAGIHTGMQVLRSSSLSFGAHLLAAGLTFALNVMDHRMVCSCAVSSAPISMDVKGLLLPYRGLALAQGQGLLCARPSPACRSPHDQTSGSC